MVLFRREATTINAEANKNFLHVRYGVCLSLHYYTIFKYLPTQYGSFGLVDPLHKTNYVSRKLLLKTFI